MATEIQHFIGGKLVPGKSGKFAPVFNPATGEHAAPASSTASCVCWKRTRSASPPASRRNTARSCRTPSAS